MKELGYHAMAMGNREFHYIRSIMKWRRDETGFPILSANLFDMTGKSVWNYCSFFNKRNKRFESCSYRAYRSNIAPRLFLGKNNEI